jgi:hypothetical protein
MYGRRWCTRMCSIVVAVACAVLQTGWGFRLLMRVSLRSLVSRQRVVILLTHRQLRICYENSGW